MIKVIDVIRLYRFYENSFFSARMEALKEQSVGGEKIIDTEANGKIFIPELNVMSVKCMQSNVM